MHHELGLTNNPSDIETAPYHGENELKEGVLEALEESCKTIREFQQDQYAELMKLINSEALKLARMQFPENMRELSATMRNKKAPEQARENARAQVREIVDFMKRVIMNEINVGNVDDPPIENARNIVNGVIEDYGINRNDPQAVLDALGVLRIDEEGKKTYRYPGEPLMPQQTTAAYSAYKKAVDEHEAAGELFKQDKSDDNRRNDLIKADMARRYAHNAVARDFKKIFGLNHPDGTPYTEKDYRELITEMFVTDRQNEQ